MRFTFAASTEAPDEAARPKGVSLTALVLAVLAVATAKNLANQFDSQSGVSSQNLLGLCYGALLLAFGWYAVWSYWKGRHWARTVVLVASFMIVIGGISNVFEGGSLVALMSRPLYFLGFALGAFLLYWLNTPPLRAWFRNTATAADLIAPRLTDKLCTKVEKIGAAPNEEWRLAFEHDAELTLHCPWRIVLDDNLAFASNASEVSADVEQASQLLQNLRVKAVRVAPRSSDLFLLFEMGIELQSWSADPRLQQWKFSDPTLTVVADSVGVSSQAMTASVLGEDTSEND